MSSISLESIFQHLNISPKYHTPILATSAPIAKNINNPNADDTGLLECGCYDTCHGVCNRFHHRHHLALHATTWRNNTMTMSERKQLLSDVEDIKEFNIYGSVSQCEHCNVFYPPAFLVYPSEAGAEYKPMCIPCVAKFGLPNEKTIQILQQQYGPRKAKIFIHHYYAIARCLIRHPEVPLHHLISCQTKTTVKFHYLDDKYYYFDMNAWVTED